MTEFFSAYGLFLAKTLTAAIAFLVVAALFFALVRSARKHQQEDGIEIRNLNERLRDLADTLRGELLDEAGWKKLRKQRKAEDKARDKKDAPRKPRLFVLNFRGDLQASAVDTLREEISAVLQVAEKDDELLLKLESEGGLVHGYGLAASQLARVRDRGLRLSVAVDKVAASGGYMMACVADRILAAPFAILGSIGVVAQIPNFNRLLKRHDVDLELHTAGEYKRTLTLFGENTDAGRAKFREEIEQTHTLFKAFVAHYRPQLDLERVATGEHWFGTQALELKLVDALQTSDDYVLQRIAEAEVYAVQYKRRPKLAERLSRGMARIGDELRNGVENALARRWS
ncbi:MAG TPA: protease SohB [Solimonas sp.]